MIKYAEIKDYKNVGEIQMFSPAGTYKKWEAK